MIHIGATTGFKNSKIEWLKSLATYILLSISKSNNWPSKIRG